MSGGLEALFGIPILGSTIVVGLLWTPLVIMLALHIVTLVLAKKESLTATGNILGIATSCVGWIPFVGMVMHILTAIFTMMDAYKQPLDSETTKIVA